MLLAVTIPPNKDSLLIVDVLVTPVPVPCTSDVAAAKVAMDGTDWLGTRCDDEAVELVEHSTVSATCPGEYGPLSNATARPE